MGGEHTSAAGTKVPKTAASPALPLRSRDRDATARAIVEAAKLVLAEDGFQFFGVNAIARRAGCDKQLIYRYFGGLDGLADAIGADLAAELTLELTPFSAETRPQSYAELMERLAFSLLDLLLRNRLMQQINAWESAMASPLVQRLVEARSHRLAQWMHEMRGSLAPPAGIDAPAINAMIIAGIQQLVLSSTASGAFAGVAIKTDADWTRVKGAISAMVRAIYAEKSS